MAQETPEEQEKFQEWLESERRRVLEQEKGSSSVRESPIEGRGVFASRDFAEREIISHYLAGPYEDIRSSEHEDPKDEFWKYATQVGVGEDGYGLYISVARENPRSQINHRCEPNAGLHRAELPGGEGCEIRIFLQPDPFERGRKSQSTMRLLNWKSGKSPVRVVLQSVEGK